jgi:hypothetical protein
MAERRRSIHDRGVRLPSCETSFNCQGENEVSWLVIRAKESFRGDPPPTP